MTTDQLILSYNEMQANEPEFPIVLKILLALSILTVVISISLARRGEVKYKNFAKSSLIVFSTICIFSAGYSGYTSENKEDIWKKKILYGTYVESLDQETFPVESYSVGEGRASVTFYDKDNKEETIIVMDGTIDDVERSYIRTKVIPKIKGVTSSVEYYDTKLYLSYIELAGEALKQLNERLDNEGK